MNRQALVCRNILEKPDITQREMAKNMEICTDLPQYPGAG